ncbi:MAG: alpha-hydroxy-acid oxidizing protein [Clostridiales bacterium]|nr:alpha-hydroxy-acid oxidizing protein [Clostridiales bacterium]
MNFKEARENVRKIEGFSCRACKECNGVVCRGEIPGVGGKGTGSGFIRNYNKVQEILLNMDTLYTPEKVDTSIELFGKTFNLPIFAAPIGGLFTIYGDKLTDYEYSKHILEGCKLGGGAGFLGDGIKEEHFEGPMSALKDVSGWGVPTIKPWENEEIFHKLDRAEEEGAMAIAMDVDAAGLSILAAAGKPVSPKSEADLKAYVAHTDIPFIVKGIMTVQGALKALEAGAYGIVVSNHGGRVLDHTPSTVEVLPEIAAAVKGKMKIFIDGGIRSGYDVLKVLALGADAVLIGRPYAVAAYGGGTEAVKSYTEQLGAELKDAMIMTGCLKLSDINESKIYVK